MKKYFKFIFIFIAICFSFILVDNVYAADAAKLCVYEFSDYNTGAYIFVSISNDHEATLVNSTDWIVGRNIDKNLYNWLSKNKGGFSGRDYYKNNNYECPPYLIMNDNSGPWGENKFYFADDKSKGKITFTMIGESVGKLAGDILISTASSEVKNSENSHQATLPITCKYNNEIKDYPDAPTAEKFEASFTIDGFFMPSNVTAKYKDIVNGNIGIENYNYVPNDNLYYNYFKYFIKTNECPQYTILGYNLEYYDKALFIVDEDDFEYMLNEVARLDLNNYYGSTFNKIDPNVHASLNGTNNKNNSNSNSSSNSNKTSNKSNKNSTSNNNVSSNYVKDSNVDKDPNADFMVISQYKSCGGPSGTLVSRIPSIVPRITASLYNAVMVLVPVILIIMGSIDLVKGISSQKEDEMKKGRETFIKRLIGSVIVFLIVLLVKLFIGLVAGGNNNRGKIVHCIDCFIANECDTME